MQNFSRALPKTQQVCPMCHAQLPAGVLYCDACGTDLSRAGVLFSTSVRPVSRQRFAVGRAARTAALLGGIFAAVVLGLVGLGSIPQVSARMPAILTITAPIRGALNQALEWGSQLVGRERIDPVPPAPVVAPAPLPAPAAPAAWSPYLIVRSTPDGADVFMNAQHVGKTPLTLRQLRPGTYTVKVARKGYTSSSRKVELKPNVGMAVTLQLKPTAAPAPKASPAPKPAPAPKQAASGTAIAPGFNLKDRRGVIYRLSDFRGRRLTLLVIWDLDGTTEHLIRNLQARTGGRDALVVVIRPNRLALRRFVDAERITLPILLGDPDLAAEYRVPEGVAVLFLINEQGRVQTRHIATKQ